MSMILKLRALRFNSYIADRWNILLLERAKKQTDVANCNQLLLFDK